MNESKDRKRTENREQDNGEKIDVQMFQILDIIQPILLILILPNECTL